jgi:ubiquitin-like 1-activating enzyme E1 A
LNSIRKANVLLIRIKGLANEIAKNLVLAGIHSITVIDHEPVTEDDLGAQFFINESHIGQNRAQASVSEIQRLNPRVKVTADTDNIELKPDLRTYVAPFDLVIATDLSFTTASLVSAACRMALKPSYVAGTHGMYGYIFADLIQHTFTIERKKFNAPTKTGPETLTRTILSSATKQEKGELKETVLKQEDFTPLVLANTSPLPAEILGKRRKLRQVTPLLSGLRALWDFEQQNGRMPGPRAEDIKLYTARAMEKHKELQLPIETMRSEFLRSFLQNLGSELAPVTAALGGMLAQDAINVLGKREQPIQNLVLFDGEEYQAPMYSLHPIFNDGLDAMVTGDPNAMSVDGSLTSGMDMSAMSATDPLLAAGTGSSTNGASFP